MEKFNLNSGLKKFGTAALAALVLFAGGAAGSYIATRYTVTEAGVGVAANPGGAASASAPTVFDQKNPYVAIVKRSSPAVVNIDVETMVTEQPVVNPFQGNPFFEEFFGEEFFGPQQRQSQPRKVPRRGKGSGFIVSKEGYILTNNHVVEDADKIKVTLLDGRTFDAKKVGQDPTFDLAVIQIKAKDLPVLPLGDSGATEVGEQVVAIGNPHGFENTVTAGIISAKNRTLQAPGINFQGFLQTDAAINPGNSGGALVNRNGEIIGINSNKLANSNYEGMGFAIPSNTVKEVVEQLIQYQKVIRPALNVTFYYNVTPTFAELNNLSVDYGVVVEVAAGGVSAAAGMQTYDIILAINGEKIEDWYDLQDNIFSREVGETVTVTIYRPAEDTTMDLEVTLAQLE